MNGWIWTLVVLLLIDAVAAPLLVGKIRSAGDMATSSVLSLLVVRALLHLGGVL